MTPKALSREETEKIIQNIKEQVERELDMGGLSDVLYGDYATEVSKRVLNTVLHNIKKETVELIENHYQELTKEN